MRRKDRIWLIVKILLILIFVPVGCVSLANTITSGSASNNRVKTNQLFTNTTHPNLLIQCTCHSQNLDELNYDLIQYSLTRVSHRQRDLLAGSSRTFCLYRGANVGIGNYRLGSDGQWYVTSGDIMSAVKAKQDDLKNPNYYPESITEEMQTNTNARIRRFNKCR